MDKKSKIILILLIITLLSLSSYASLSRFSKGVNKEGSINTTELGYCQLNEIETLGECLIRNDSKQELSSALSTIDERTSLVDFSKVEPLSVYTAKTKYVDVPDKTSTVAIRSVSSNIFTYTIESKLINPFDVNDSEIENISFNEETGYYTYTNSVTGNINDIITTEEDMNNGIYKYTCLNTVSTGNCMQLYLFTENAYLIGGLNLFKQGYVYSSEASNTTNTNAGLYKGDDDYTIDEDTHTYYYRGDVNNNWVKYGNSLWRVVRINGNGTIRLIYSGLLESNHTGINASVNRTLYSDRDEYSIVFPRINNLNTVTLNYQSGRFSNTYVGYMYNPEKVVLSFPDKTPSNTPRYTLDYFSTYVATRDANYYFFKNFNPEEDCYLGNGENDSGTCVLKCNKLGEYGEEGTDCIENTWEYLMSNPANYSDTAPGVYKSGSTEFDVYQMSDTDGGYRYVCAGDSGSIKLDNDEVYAACPVVIEIVGAIKGNPWRAKVKFHGVYSQDAAMANTNVLDSEAKSEVDKWYENSILNNVDENGNNLEDYLSDAIFCNDRVSNQEDTFPLSNIGGSYIYKPYTRMVSAKNPSFKCLKSDGTLNTNDAFTLKTTGTSSTVEASGIGNNMLKYPAALITADEVAFAGGVYGIENTSYYLYVGSSYHTMTPCFYTEGSADIRMLSVLSNGNLSYGADYGTKGVRPVINLKSDILYKGGTGTEEDPYIIDINN